MSIHCAVTIIYQELLVSLAGKVSLLSNRNEKDEPLEKRNKHKRKMIATITQSWLLALSHYGQSITSDRIRSYSPPFMVL